MTKAGVWRRPTPKPPASANPRRQPLRQRRAQVARFGEAVGGNRLGGQNRLGDLRGGVPDHRVGDPPQPPAGETGQASRRERVREHVSTWVVAGSLKTQATSTRSR